jgi:hypothetical protein
MDSSHPLIHNIKDSMSIITMMKANVHSRINISTIITPLGTDLDNDTPAPPFITVCFTEVLDAMGDAAMCRVERVRPPQPEQIHADGTLFFLIFE